MKCCGPYNCYGAKKKVVFGEKTSNAVWRGRGRGKAYLVKTTKPPVDGEKKSLLRLLREKDGKKTGRYRGALRGRQPSLGKKLFTRGKNQAKCNSPWEGSGGGRLKETIFEKKVFLERDGKQEKGLGENQRRQKGCHRISEKGPSGRC